MMYSFYSETNNTYYYKNEKYCIIGFDLSNFVDNYNYVLKLGEKNPTWGFNINGNLIGISSQTKNSLNLHSADIIDENLYVVTSSHLYEVNMINLICSLTLNLDDFFPLNQVYKFYNGLILIGETDILYFENDRIIWYYNRNDAYIKNVVMNSDNTISVLFTDMNKDCNTKVTINAFGKVI